MEASYGLEGICAHCNGHVIAKCGRIRIHHWAHKSGKKRDCKWEPETIWHRDWKNEFPNDWQECSQRDENGKLHVADILTAQGLAVEIQHSSIDRDEVSARTAFYKSICWIIDGNRLKTSWKQFKRALGIGFRQHFSDTCVHKIFAQDSMLLKKWSRIDALIVFDFGENGLWVVDHGDGYSAYTYRIDKEVLLKHLKQGKRPTQAPAFNEKPSWPI
jgi:competence protein CoiA